MLQVTAEFENTLFIHITMESLKVCVLLKNAKQMEAGRARQLETASLTLVVSCVFLNQQFGKSSSLSRFRVR